MLPNAGPVCTPWAIAEWFWLSGDHTGDFGDHVMRICIARVTKGYFEPDTIQGENGVVCSFPAFLPFLHLLSAIRSIFNVLGLLISSCLPPWYLRSIGCGAWKRCKATAGKIGAFSRSGIQGAQGKTLRRGSEIWWRKSAGEGKLARN